MNGKNGRSNRSLDFFLFYIFLEKDLEGEKMEKDWQFYIDSYTGKGGFEDGSYLIKYPRESDEKFERRKQLAIYPNYVKKIVDTYISHLFKQAPIRETTPEYNDFIQNVDRQGTYIDDFMRKAGKLSLIFGTVLIVVDRPRGKAKTKLEEKQLGLTPYAVIKLPYEVEEAKLDEYGNISRIVFKENETYRTFTDSSWIISKDKEGKQIIDAGSHELGVVPVVPIRWTDTVLPFDIFSPPFIKDIAQINFDLYNAISELREILRNITFPVFTIPIRDEQTASQLANMTIGTENFVGYDPEGGGKPDFIAPPPDPAKIYLEYINFLISQMYKIVNLEFAMGSQSGKSGVALDFEFQQVNSLMAGIALHLEQAEYKIAELVARWNGEDSFKGKIEYNKDFSFKDIERELKNAMDALSLQISQTFDAELKKKLARELLGDYIDEPILERIDKEIDGLEGLDNQLKNEGL